jgi:hypothetical protein
MERGEEERKNLNCRNDIFKECGRLHKEGTNKRITKIG